MLLGLQGLLLAADSAVLGLALTVMGTHAMSFHRLLAGSAVIQMIC
jgi:hypothetical protein